MRQGGLGIAAFVLGIIGLLSSCLVFGGIFAIIGLFLAIADLRNRDVRHGLAIAGLVCSMIGILVAAIILVLSMTTPSKKSDNKVSATQTIESVWAKAPTPLEDFKYDINVYDKQIVLKSYEGKSKKVWISSEYVIDDVIYQTDFADASVFYCDKITSAIIGDGIKTISNNCFNSTDLEYIYIPNTAQYNKGDGIFGYLHGLKEFYYGGSNEEFYKYSKSVDEEILKYIPVYVNSSILMDGTGVAKGTLYDKKAVIPEVKVSQDEEIWNNSFTPISDFRYSIQDNGIVLSRYVGEDEKIFLSPVYNIDGKDYPLISMGENACFLCETNITSVYIPNGVTFIGDTTFNSCTSLEYIYIPKTVEKLNPSFFGYVDNYEVICDSAIEATPERDMNLYALDSEELETAALVGEDAGRAVNGFLAGFNQANSDSICIKIYYGGSQDDWNAMTSR